jgi:hypothetical protein
VLYVFFLSVLILPFFISQVESGTSTNTLYAHAETTTIGGVNYYLHKLSSADGPGITLPQSIASTGRKLAGKFVYQLTGVSSIPVSTWIIYYRAYTGGGTVHCDVGILIRKSDGTIRETKATNVANSANLGTAYSTVSGTYSWTAYTVVDPTDYLEIDYYFEVTIKASGKSAYLRIDDNTLAIADQTKIANVMFTYPNQAPVASFTFSPSNPLIYDNVTFDASASYDPDGSIVSYKWDFGDGNITTVTNPIITHAYTTAQSTVNYTVTLTVTDNEGSIGSASQIVPVTNPSILYVSLPAGTYHGPDSDHWLSQCWLLNITSTSMTFTVRINNTHASYISYNTHLIIALNDAAHTYLNSLTVDATTILKSSFISGTPKPYGFTLTWENDVYPTWFSDTYVVGTINPKNYKNVQVSVTFSNSTGVRMHFDAYGSADSSPPPCSKGHVTDNPHEKDSTVLFFQPTVQYYLTVSSSYDTVGGQGWYGSGSTAYATLNTGIVDHGNRTRRVFLYWSGDASGNNYAQSDPILMNHNKTAIAVWKTQYYLNVTSPYGTPSGAGWYDRDFNAYASLNTNIIDHGNGTRRVFTNWSGDASGTDYTSSNPIMMNGPKTAIAVWKKQYYLTVTSPYGIVGGADWYDTNTIAYATLNTGTVDYGNGTRRIFNYWSGDASGTNYAQSDPITMNGPKTAIANWKTLYRLIVRTSGLGTYITNVYNGTTVLGSATDAAPYICWFDKGSSISLNIDSPITDGSKRFVFTQWSGDAAGTARPVSVTMSTARDITANYKTQYQITVTASPGEAVGGTFKVTYTSCGTVFTNVIKTTSWTEWADASTTVTVSEPQDIISGSPGTRYKFDHYDLSASVTMDQAKTITLVYKTQYYLTVKTNPAEVLTLNPAAVSGEGWYDSGFTATVNAVQNVDKVPGQSQYDFRTWTGAAPTGVGNQATVFMDNSKTATANYQLQYKITFNQSGVGGDFGDTVVIIDSTNNYGVGSLPKWFWWDDSSTHTFAFQSPLVVGSTSKQYVWANTTGLSTLQGGSIFVSTSGSVTGNYKIQYYLTVTSPYGTPGGQGWYNSGDKAYATLDIGIFDHGNGTRRVFKNWNGDASGTNYVKSDAIIMDGPKTAVAMWKTQYKLTVRTSGLGTKTTNVYNGTAVLGTAKDGSPYVDWFDKNVVIQLDIDTPISGSPIRYVFTQWTGGASGSTRPYPVTMSSPKDITANYKTQYQITVTASPSGAVGGKFKVTYTQCGTTYTSIEKVTSWTEWVDASTTVTVSDPQDVVNGYNFDSYNPSASVTMDQTRTITLVYKAFKPLSVSISPTSAAVSVGQSVTFTSTPSGGYSPYTYQWYLGGVQVSGATSDTWTFTPTTSGIYYVYLQVKDTKNNVAQSETARITVTVIEIPVGGYSISLAKRTPTSYMAVYTMLIALFATILGLTKRKRK